MKVMYIGTFSPVTIGHRALVCELLAEFDQMLIGIGRDPKKDPLFSNSERVYLFELTMADLIWEYKYRFLTHQKFSVAEEMTAKKLEKDKNAFSALFYDDMTVDFAFRNGVNILARGERIIGDHDSEMELAMMNKVLGKVRSQHLLQMQICTPQECLTFISSSKAHGFCQGGEYISAQDFVSPGVHNAMMQKYLKTDFLALAKDLGCDSDDVAQACWYELSMACQHYHLGLSHIGYCLNRLKDYRAAGNEVEHYNELKAAIYYSAFDRFSTKDSSIKSLELMEKSPKKSQDMVRGLIHLLDEEAKNPQSFEEQLFNDIYYSILGDPYNYGKYYALAQRRDTPFADRPHGEQRIEAIKKMLARKEIYALPCFIDKYAETAEDNLKQELFYWQNYI